MYIFRSKKRINQGNILKSVVNNSIYNDLKTFTQKIRRNILGNQTSMDIQYKILYSEEIKDYRSSHHNTYPHTTCLGNIGRTLIGKSHPYSYDYCGITKDDILFTLRSIKKCRIAVVPTPRYNLPNPVINKIRHESMDETKIGNSPFNIIISKSYKTESSTCTVKSPLSPKSTRRFLSGRSGEANCLSDGANCIYTFPNRRVALSCLSQ